jgi:flagellar biosynthesis/type III secretory pathway protein FliH
MLQERVIEWTKQWKEEGRQEGLEAGERSGRRQMILRLVEQRFGPLADEQRRRVEAADVDALADRLFDASSLADLLGE